MVFCLAALYSHYATAVLEEEAINTYKEASDFFLYVRDNLPDIYRLDGMTDLGVEPLSAFSLIMQAQGEELSAFKASLDGVGPEQTEKIAKRASSLYRQAAAFCELSTQPFPENWVSRLIIKADLMEAQAEYNAAVIAGGTNNYSGQILHLTQTYILLYQCRSIDDEKVSAACTKLISAIEEAKKNQSRSRVTLPGSATPLRKLSTINISALFSCIPPIERRNGVMDEVRRLRRATDQCLSDLSSCGFLTGLPYILGSELAQSLRVLAQLLRDYGGSEKLYNFVGQIDEHIGELQNLLNKMSVSLDLVRSRELDPDYKQLLAELTVNIKIFERVTKLRTGIASDLSECGGAFFLFSRPDEEIIIGIQGLDCPQPLLNDDAETRQLADSICAEIFRVLSKRRDLEQTLLKLNVQQSYEQTLSNLRLLADESIESQAKQMSLMMEVNKSLTIQPACTEVSLVKLVHHFGVFCRLSRYLNDALVYLPEAVEKAQAFLGRVEEYVSSVRGQLAASPETEVEVEDVPEHVSHIVIESDNEEYGEV
uniref:BRO1 domain-containing protein n=3 Tax=Schistocephalus solidus TaxID=70667 RepID=A0A0X3PS28_SCHSO